jgi:DNA polymerase-1
VLSLIGDNVDNIPGVDGLGPKGAASLLNAHGSLVAILANPDVVKNERMREKLKANREQIIQNREMVRLDLDLPLPRPLEDLAIVPHYPELIAELEKCDFNSLLAEVKTEASALAPKPPEHRQGELF